jgi:hypothetical protein
MRARYLAAVVLMTATAVGWSVDRALAAPTPPAKAPVPLSAPARACVLKAVDCTNDKDSREEVQCTAIALAAGATVVVRSKDSPHSFLVVVWRDACK